MRLISQTAESNPKNTCVPICVSCSSAVRPAAPTDEPDADAEAESVEEDELDELPEEALLSLDASAEAEAAVDADAPPDASLETSEAVSQAASRAAAANNVRRRWIILVSNKYLVSIMRRPTFQNSVVFTQ